MAGSSEDPEVFDLDSGTFAVFLGQFGLGGLLIHREPSGWSFHPRGSLVWDEYHQWVYRNHKATPSSLAEFAARGLPPPPIAAHQGDPGVSWESNFKRELALEEVPGKLRSLLLRGTLQVYLLLVEDTYETRLGDGKFLYPEAAFFSFEDAQRNLQWRQRHEPDAAKRQYYEYSVKQVALVPTGDRVFLHADVRAFEHVTVDAVVALLATGSPRGRQ